MLSFSYMLKYIFLVFFLLFIVFIAQLTGIAPTIINHILKGPLILSSIYFIAFVPLIIIFTKLLENFYSKKSTFFLMIIAFLILQCVPLPYDEEHIPLRIEIKPKAIGFGFPFSLVKYYLGESCLPSESSCVSFSDRARQLELRPESSFFTKEEAQEVANSYRSRAIFPGTIQFTGANILGVIIWGPQLILAYLILKVINQVWKPNKNS